MPKEEGTACAAVRDTSVESSRDFRLDIKSPPVRYVGIADRCGPPTAVRLQVELAESFN